MTVLKRRKKSMGWRMSDITGINSAFYMHKIHMEEGLNQGCNNNIG